MAQENDHVRKGPWTENEDVQLVFYVNMFGDRRWDFIAKVSGLKRTGKSCRLRWVNYLHPGLKRGKMTPHEERLVLEFHAKWGNRWSRIARKLPGRTDNEIKNYWRTHMRKKAQEMKRASSPPSSSSYSSSSSSSSASSHVVPVVETDERSFYDTGGVLAPSSLISNKSCSSFDSINPIMEMKERKSYDVGELGMLIPRGKKDKEEEKMEKVISMDDIWEDLALSGSNTLNSVHDFSTQTITSPIWKYCPDLSWGMEEEGEMIFPPMSDRSFAHYGLEGSNLTG